MNDTRFTPAQQRSILKSWELDARRIADATNEGMDGGEPARLEAVLQALRTLENADRTAADAKPETKA